MSTDFDGAIDRGEPNLRQVSGIAEPGRRTTATVHDVAAYILAEHGPMSVLKLQRLCYFAYGYHLAWEHQRLFEEPFEAWANGPVVRELYRQHRGRFQLNIGDIEGSVAALDNGERDSVDIVLETFAPYPTHELSAMSHQTTGPWQHARDRAGAADLERSDEVLLDEEIAHYFDALSDRAG